MEFFKLYYIALPLLSYNLYFTMNILSNSISSSKNIMNIFISTKDQDIVLFKNHLEEVDLKTKIKVIESLTNDIIKKYCNNDNIKFELKNSIITECEPDKENNFCLVDVKENNEYLKNIDEPVLFSLIAICEIIHNINDNLNNINEKIILHENSYFRNMTILKLQPELSNIIRYSKILDIRLNLLFDILKIYSPIIKT